MLHYNALKYWYRQIALTAFGMLLSLPVFAHPHSFIDMQTTVESHDEQITGLRMQWTMDPLTSADLLYDAGDAAKGSEVWKKLAAEVMANVIGQHYFTEIYRDKQPIKYASMPTEYHLSRSGNQAVLEFVLPLAHPQSLIGEPLQILTYDPSYYVDMSYQNENAIKLATVAASRCKTTLVIPKPSQDLQSYALSLDKDDSPGEDMELGKQFAQRVTLQCR